MECMYGLLNISLHTASDLTIISPYRVLSRFPSFQMPVFTCGAQKMGPHASTLVLGPRDVYR